MEEKNGKKKLTSLSPRFFTRSFLSDTKSKSLEYSSLKNAKNQAIKRYFYREIRGKL